MALNKIRLLIFIVFSLLAMFVSAQVHQTDQIEVELVSETINVVPGQTTWLAIRLDPIDHWHTYWKFGGDSGEATRAVDWQLPAGGPPECPPPACSSARVTCRRGPGLRCPCASACRRSWLRPLGNSARLAITLVALANWVEFW